VGLAPPNNAPSPPKLKYGILYTNGVFAFKPPCTNVQAPLQKRKAPIEDFLATVLLILLLLSSFNGIAVLITFQTDYSHLNSKRLFKNFSDP